MVKLQTCSEKLRGKTKSMRINISQNPSENFNLSDLIARLCQIYAKAFFSTLIFSLTKRKMDACGNNLIYSISWSNLVTRVPVLYLKNHLCNQWCHMIMIKYHFLSSYGETGDQQGAVGRLVPTVGVLSGQNDQWTSAHPHSAPLLHHHHLLECGTQWSSLLLCHPGNVVFTCSSWTGEWKYAYTTMLPSSLLY